VPHIPTPPVISFQIVFPIATESTGLSEETTISISSSSISINQPVYVTICQPDDKILIEVLLLDDDMQPQVLVTGFEPFGLHQSNISEIIARSINGKSVRGHTIITKILTVDEKGANTVSNLINDADYSAVLHLGLAEKATQPRIEIKARDVLDFSIADNSGRLVKNTPISGNGDLFSTINIEDWDVESMIDRPVISDDAGNYICNETLYRTLEANERQIPCCFLHLPLKQSDAEGLVIQCLDRMLRPPCIDVGAGAIISNGKFLAARRAPSEKHAGWWEFPGGKFEQGETAEECLIREIKEELELDVTVHEDVGKWIFDHDDVVVRLHVMICKIVSGELKLSVHDEIKWCENSNQVNWLGPDKEIAEAISAMLPNQH